MSEKRRELGAIPGGPYMVYKLERLDFEDKSTLYFITEYEKGGQRRKEIMMNEDELRSLGALIKSALLWRTEKK